MKRVALFAFSIALFSFVSADAQAGFGWFKGCHKKSCCQTYTVCCQTTCGCEAAPSCCGGESVHAEPLPMGEHGGAPAPTPYDDAAPMPPADKGPAPAPAPKAPAPAPKAAAEAAPAPEAAATLEAAPAAPAAPVPPSAEN